MTLRYSLCLRPVLWIALCCMLTTACFVPYAPEMRGWKCNTNSDCLSGLKCFGQQCRATCTKTLDCQQALYETCLSNGYCCDVQPETCNGKDDDCDGTIDNEAKCASGSCQDGKCQ